MPASLFRLGPPPLTLGYMTFIFGGSNGFAKSAVLVDASQAGMTFAVTFTGLSGKVAGRPAVSTTTSWYGGYCPMEAALPRPSATPAPSLESTSMETLRRGA